MENVCEVVQIKAIHMGLREEKYQNIFFGKPKNALEKLTN